MKNTLKPVRKVSLKELLELKKTKTAEKNFNWWLNTTYIPVHGETFFWMVEQVWGKLPDAEELLSYIVQQGCMEYILDEDTKLELERKNKESKSSGSTKRYSHLAGANFHRVLAWGWIEKLQDLKVLEYVEHPKKYLYEDLEVQEAIGMPLFNTVRGEIEEVSWGKGWVQMANIGQ